MNPFEKNSNLNKDANVKQVKFGAEKPVLEVELNEMQIVQSEKLKSFIKSTLASGRLGQGTISYTGGNVVVQDETFIVDGELVYVSSLSISASNNQTVYLEVWDKEVDYQDTLKRGGNEQEDSTANYLLDSRVGSETSRRVVTAFNLSKNTNNPDSRYLKLCRIVSGSMSEMVGTSADKDGHQIVISDTEPEFAHFWLDTSE